jgi:hypothetical protein
VADDAGVITADRSAKMQALLDSFTRGIAQHRHWDRNVMPVQGGVALPVG